MSIDKEKLTTNLGDIQESLGELQELAGLSKEEFLQDKEFYKARYLLIVVTESIGNICLHVAARDFSRSVGSIPESIELVGSKGVIGVDLAERLVNLGRLRNLLVHRYWEIDDTKVYRYLNEHLRDIEEFILVIKRYAEK